MGSYPRYMQIFYGIRSTLFYLGYGLSACLYAPLVLLVGLFLPFKFRVWFINRWSWFVLLWLRLTCGISVCLNYKKREHHTDPCIVLSNHQSTWEALFLQLVFWPSITVVKKDLINIPFFGWGLRMLKPIVIDRAKPRVAGKQFLEQGQQALQEKNWVVLFPEGTRVAQGEQKSLSLGGFRLAHLSKTQIIPIYHNAGACWPPRQFTKYPGTITCIVGDPIEPHDSPRELADRYKAAIEAMAIEVSQ